jgi:hypothetical protein
MYPLATQRCVCAAHAPAAHRPTIDASPPHQASATTLKGSCVPFGGLNVGAVAAAPADALARDARACVRGIGRTGAQRLRVVVEPAGRVRVEVDAACDRVPKAAGGVVRGGRSVTERHARDEPGTRARILGDEPNVACRAAAPAGATEREGCAKKTGPCD